MNQTHMSLETRILITRFIKMAVFQSAIMYVFKSRCSFINAAFIY